VKPACGWKNVPRGTMQKKDKVKKPIVAENAVQKENE